MKLNVLAYHVDVEFTAQNVRIEFFTSSSMRDEGLENISNRSCDFLHIFFFIFRLLYTIIQYFGIMFF